MIFFSYVFQVDSSINDADVHRSRSQLDAYEDFTNLRASDLKLRIEEMLRIKVNLSTVLMIFTKIVIIFYLFSFLEHRIIRTT